MTTPRDAQHVKMLLDGIESTARLLGLPDPDDSYPVLSKDTAEAILTLAKSLLHTVDQWAASKIILQEPGVQCRGWCLTLEETNIEFWPGWLIEQTRSIEPERDPLTEAGVFAEAVSHCHLGLYPA